MPRTLDRFTTALSALVVIAALLACKKKTPVPTAPSAEPVAAATAAAPPTAIQPAAAPESAAKLGEVKRYADKEKPQTGAARTVADQVKVFNEADEKTAEVATLPKDLLVFRVASIPDWELVEFPSGLGKVSPGWVQARFVDGKADAAVARDAVAAQAKQGALSPTGSAAAQSSSALAPTAKQVLSPAQAKAAADKAAAAKASADKAAADKAAADKAAADQAAADKAAADRAAARAARVAARAAARAKAAADAAAAGK